jgi:hypothetical protein
LMPSFWPASTVEMLMRCDETESSASDDQQFADLANGQMPWLQYGSTLCTLACMRTPKKLVLV